MLLLSASFAWWQNEHTIEPVAITPTITDQVEYCLTCHADLPEISPSHPVQTFGCVICHGGERLALDAGLAHSTMRGIANPSQLEMVEPSCGGNDCHSGPESKQQDHIQRVMTSIQTTYAGAIANIRYTFGAQPDLNAYFGARAVQDITLPSKTGIVMLEAFNAAVETNLSLKQFGQNCLNCHINATPRNGEAYARLTGCTACHTPDAPDSSRPGAEGQTVHTFTTAIPYTQCNTCHNRGNYNLRTMTFEERQDPAPNRLHAYYQPIAQFTRCEYTLDCIDCHTRTEVMGDGDIHRNMADIRYIECRTCHGTLTALPLTKEIIDPNDIAFKLARLNPVVSLELGDFILVTERGEPLWNIRLMPDGNYQLVGKVTGQRLTFRPVMGSACQQNIDRQQSQYCHECHAVER